MHSNYITFADNTKYIHTIFGISLFFILITTFSKRLFGEIPAAIFKLLAISSLTFGSILFCKHLKLFILNDKTNLSNKQILKDVSLSCTMILSIFAVILYSTYTIVF